MNLPDVVKRIYNLMSDPSDGAVKLVDQVIKGPTDANKMLDISRYLNKIQQDLGGQLGAQKEQVLEAVAKWVDTKSVSAEVVDAVEAYQMAVQNLSDPTAGTLDDTITVVRLLADLVDLNPAVIDFITFVLRLLNQPYPDNPDKTVFEVLSVMKPELRSHLNELY